MLVISRKIGESFVIGDDIEVTVLDITGDKVVLGIVAPKDIPITRLSAAHAENAKASGSPTPAINEHGYGRKYKPRSSSEKE